MPTLYRTFHNVIKKDVFSVLWLCLVTCNQKVPFLCIYSSINDQILVKHLDEKDGKFQEQVHIIEVMYMQQIYLVEVMYH